MNAKVLLAVFKRNLTSYFSSPTGYLFLCVFVLLSTTAAFWPPEFFNANLANLNQLNWVFPFIMLVFIPAITMGMWADERRQGTDELLLTIPAADFDIVLGKYLAAVAIYTVSLVFSLVCSSTVLVSLGEPDAGLFLATYVGYWLIGLGMLAIGMVASFLTSNLTVAYILGTVFNMPLVFLAYADTIVYKREWAMAIKQWSISDQFRDYGRGTLSFGGLVYFVAIVAVMLYLSMVLIGRRHWSGRGNSAMSFHYLVRALSLAAVAVSVSLFFHTFDLRADVTSERLSSLSPETVALLKNLKADRPVQIEAFISPEVPEGYVQTRLDLISMLQELEARGGEKARVRINATERFSEEAARAEKRYDINPRRVVTLNRGTLAEDHIFMGVAFTCGLEKVILPFIDRGIPVEYELVRSIATVTQQKRKKVGVLQTDAQLYGRFNMQSMSSAGNWPIIDELEKQYEVVQVDATKPITERYDVLLAVQPSSLSPEQMDNFVAAVRAGQPTAIFEDPFPVFAAEVPATSAPRRPPGGMQMFMQQPLPKGNIESLWGILGVDFGPDQIIWQDYNPYPKLSQLPKEFVFVDTVCGAEEPFGSDPISSRLQHILFPFPGAISKLNASNFQFNALVRTGVKSGTVRYGDVMQMTPFGPMGGLNPNRRQIPGNVSYVLAAHLRGKLPADPPPAAEEKGKPAPKPATAEINVVLVADIDMLHQEFFRLREQGEIPEAGISFDFDNVTFVLNALDALAGDQRFLELRKRRPKHRTLSQIDKSTEEARKETDRTREKLQSEFDKAREQEEKVLKDKIGKLEQRMKKEKIDAQEIILRVSMAQEDGERRMQAKLDQLKQERDRDVNRIETQLNLEVRRVQDRYKRWAVIVPPILPLFVAAVVFFVRRYHEREGVSRSRLRS